MSNPQPTNPTNEQELRELYLRCDVSNYRTRSPIGENEFVSAITAHTNAEIAKVLDRLEGNKETLYWWTGGEYDKTTAVDMLAIAAERELLTKLEAEL